MAMWHAEHTLDSSADPRVVWGRLADVSAWPEWEEGVTWAELSGPFVSGTRGRMKVQGEGTRSFQLAKVAECCSFTAQVRLLFAVVSHIHCQEASDLGTKMTHRIEITGLLSWLYGWTRGKKLTAGLAPSLRRLGRLASEASSSCRVPQVP